MAYEINENINWTDEIKETVHNSGEYYQNASSILDEARKNDDNLELYTESAIMFGKAANEQLKLIQLVDKVFVNFHAVISANYHYYLYESARCIYAYHFKNNDFTSALQSAEQSVIQINEACKLIEQNEQILDKNAKEYFNEVKPKWILSRISSLALTHEPLARQAMRKEDYITALDQYRVIDTISNREYEYLSTLEVDPCTKRIAIANYYTTKSNVANALAGVLYNKTSNIDVVKLLELMLDSLNRMRKARETNPEWDKYQEGVNISIKNINLMLAKYPKLWFEFYISLESNIELFNLLKMNMRRIDVMRYNDVELKAISNSMSKVKKTIFYGIFYLFILIVIFSGLFILSKSMSWAYFVGVVVIGFIAFILIESTILRSTGDLSEENWMLVIKLVFKMISRINLDKKT
jgi:hypothetical protein